MKTGDTVETVLGAGTLIEYHETSQMWSVGFSSENNILLSRKYIEWFSESEIQQAPHRKTGRPAR